MHPCALLIFFFICQLKVLLFHTCTTNISSKIFCLSITIIFNVKIQISHNNFGFIFLKLQKESLKVYAPFFCYILHHVLHIYLKICLRYNTIHIDFHKNVSCHIVDCSLLQLGFLVKISFPFQSGVWLICIHT